MEGGCLGGSRWLVLCLERGIRGAMAGVDENDLRIVFFSFYNLYRIEYGY
jgi:hypothetical protein